MAAYNSGGPNSGTIGTYQPRPATQIPGLPSVSWSSGNAAPIPDPEIDPVTGKPKYVSNPVPANWGGAGAGSGPAPVSVFAPPASPVSAGGSSSQNESGFGGVQTPGANSAGFNAPEIDANLNAKLTAVGLDPGRLSYDKQDYFGPDGQPIPVAQAIADATNKQAITANQTAVANSAVTQDQAAAVNAAAGKDITGYRPPSSNYGAPATAPSSAPKLQYGAFGMSNAEVDAFNLRMNPQPAPVSSAAVAATGNPHATALPAPAPAPAPPATTYTAPVQPQAPAPATPAAKLTQPTPPPVPSLQDLANGLLAKMQSRPR